MTEVADADRDRQAARRTKELTQQIAALQHQIAQSSSREAQLTRALEATAQRFESLEQRAVREVVDFLVAAVAATGAASPPSSLQRVRTAQRPPSNSSSSRNLTVSSSPLEGEGEEDGLAELPLPTLALATSTSDDIPRLQYEMELERLKRRSVLVTQSKQQIKATKDTIASVLEAKAHAKARIKQWLTEFQHTHQREPTIQEKAQVKDIYLAFKDNEQQYVDLKDRLAQLKAQHHEKVAAAEPAAQWKALLAAVGVTSPRPSTSGSTRSNPSRPDSAAAVVAAAAAGGEGEGGGDFASPPGEEEHQEQGETAADPHALPAAASSSAAASAEETQQLQHEIARLKAERDVLQARVRATSVAAALLL